MNIDTLLWLLYECLGCALAVVFGVIVVIVPYVRARGNDKTLPITKPVVGAFKVVSFFVSSQTQRIIIQVLYCLAFLAGFIWLVWLYSNGHTEVLPASLTSIVTTSVVVILLIAGRRIVEKWQKLLRYLRHHLDRFINGPPHAR